MSHQGNSGLQMSLGRYGEAVAARLRRWEAEDFGRRLWAKDHTLWTPEPVPELTDRMGWLELPESLLGTHQGELDALERFAEEARTEGIEKVFVLGMGGSSLAPEVFARTFGATQILRVLDSTHPDAVEAAGRGVDPAKTLFLVSSKSGGTIETLSFFRFFWQLCASHLPAGRVGRQFVAITDPGTSLERLARERGFRAVFDAPAEVGGRYSAFTNFGLVPAALAGVDLRELLERGRRMSRACAPGVPALESPGLILGAALGELALAGRDKVTFITTPSLESFPDWIEQLVAESTGKHDKGIVPVVGERPGRMEAYGRDRVFAALLLDDDLGAAEALEARLDGLETSGHPVLRFRCTDRLDLGREIFRWELATAAAGAVLGINPFDQPDVQLAKELAGRAMKQGQQQGQQEGKAEAGGSNAGETVDSLDASAVAVALGTWIEGIQPGDYIGLQAYLPPGGEDLRVIQAALRDWTRLAVTAGYGPRFLHSTGQLHKGGPGRCRFLQLVSEPHEKVPVPETDYDFASLIRAQADGDRQALEQRGRKVLRLQLGRDPHRGLERLREALGAGARYGSDGEETLPPEVDEGRRR